MRILIAHNSYQQFGGEDAVVANEQKMLSQRGHQVQMLIVSNEAITGPIAKLSAALSCIFSVRSFLRVRRIIKEFKPDVVHVHNFFPLLSPSVFYACRAAKVPVVLTLHNYRIICPTALLMHEGSINERSISSGPWWAIRKRVYRGSAAGTAALCFMIWLHKRLGTWKYVVSRFIALTNFSRAKFEDWGLPRELISVKPNFAGVSISQEPAARSGVLFVGRLSEEKGVRCLLSAFATANNSRLELRVAGDGPLKDLVSAAAGVEYLGSLRLSEVQDAMRRSVALVMPSVWYEGFPMVLVEAFACGLPVIASRLGALRELIDDGVTGLLVEPSSPSDLAAKLNWAHGHPAEMAAMGRAAKATYAKFYTAEKNYDSLIDIYREAITRPKGEKR